MKATLAITTMMLSPAGQEVLERVVLRVGDLVDPEDEPVSVAQQEDEDDEDEDDGGLLAPPVKEHYGLL